MLALQPEKCVYVIKDNGSFARCKNFALDGNTVCRIHLGKTIAVPSGYYSPLVWDTLQKMEQASTLETMDGELAYLRKTVDEVSKADFDLQTRYTLIINALDKISKLVDRRQSFLERSRYMVSIDILNTFMNQLYIILRRHINDKEILRKIGNEFSQLRASAFKARKALK